MVLFLKVKVGVNLPVESDSMTPWTVAHQAPLSMAFPRQEYWSGLPFPSPGDLSDPGIEPRSPVLQTDSLLPEPTENQVLKGLAKWFSSSQPPR